jgi:O-acetyl-ADP-ribose deacetylase
MKIQVIQGDITEIATDAIVNAANSSLLGGSGVDGAIHRKGGPAILEACMRIRERQGGCDTGQAVITTAGNLPAKYVIHTVGPIWDGSRKEDMRRLLEDCYVNSLRLALEHGLRSIAFPNIGTGVYRFPKEEAAGVAMGVVNGFDGLEAFERVVFVCFDEENFGIYERLLG